jgi:hypothetical protein
VDTDTDVVVNPDATNAGTRSEHRQGVFASQAIAGFWIDLGWLWSDPLPNPRRCLEAILAGPAPSGAGA